jgi:hypothetical protein
LEGRASQSSNCTCWSAGDASRMVARISGARTPG